MLTCFELFCHRSSISFFPLINDPYFKHYCSFRTHLFFFESNWPCKKEGGEIYMNTTGRSRSCRLQVEFNQQREQQCLRKVRRPLSRLRVVVEIVGYCQGQSWTPLSRSFWSIEVLLYSGWAHSGLGLAKFILIN